jgi:hypothetical protein
MVRALLRFVGHASVGADRRTARRLRRRRPCRFRCLLICWIVSGLQPRWEDDAAERGRAREQEKQKDWLHGIFLAKR